MKLGGDSAAQIHGYASGMVRCRTLGRWFPNGIFYGENPLDFNFSLILLQMSVIIILTRVLHILLKPLKQPRVVAEIIGGIIIGPSVLGRNKKFATAMYPDGGALVLRSVTVIGMMYFLFVTGVKMDTTMITKAGRKAIFIGLYGVFLPFGTVVSLSVLLKKHLDTDMVNAPAIGGLASSLSITAFPVLYPILKELNLLSSKVGRLAMSTSMVSDAAGWNAVIIFEAIRQGASDHWKALWYIISLFGLMAFVAFVVRPMTMWIIRRTPKGKHVDQIYVIAILLSVLVLGFISDLIGATIIDGPLMLGLAIPDGPPLGSTLVERSETIIMDLLMPLNYLWVGLNTDIFAMDDWSTLSSLFCIVFGGYMAKLLGTLLPCLYFRKPFNDAISLSLIMSLRGQVELFTFLHWADYKILRKQTFTMLVLSTTMVTAIVTPLIRILYKPTRPYMTGKRRSIQYSRPNSEFHIVACIHDQESVPSIINLLESSNPTKDSPIAVYALHLVELVGRATPMFISHDKHKRSSKLYAPSKFIVNAFKIYEQTSGGRVSIQSFTAVSPYNTMYQDICGLALEKKASLLIVPFHKQNLELNARLGSANPAMQMVTSSVLDQAPCSIGVYVHRAPHSYLVSRALYCSLHHVAVLFLGGADAREALAYADRMTGKLNVSLTVVRFFSFNSEVDDEKERWLDDELVNAFRVKNMGNDHVLYREVVVRDGEDTVSAICALKEEDYDLWIMGRQQGMNPRLVEGLSDWSENPELGVIGDFVSSPDFGGIGSVLVIQQQVLKGTAMQ